jgi:hypothetical protein
MENKPGFLEEFRKELGDMKHQCELLSYREELEPPAIEKRESLKHLERALSDALEVVLPEREERGWVYALLFPNYFRVQSLKVTPGGRELNPADMFAGAISFMEPMHEAVQSALADLPKGKPGSSTLSRAARFIIDRLAVRWHELTGDGAVVYYDRGGNRYPDAPSVRFIQDAAGVLGVDLTSTQIADRLRRMEPKRREYRGLRPPSPPA